MADFRLLARAHGFLKLAEIIIAIICLALLRNYSLNFGGDLTSGAFYDRYNTGIITLGAALIVTIPLLLSYLFSSSGTYQPFLEMIYNFTFFVLFMASGILALHHYRNYGGENVAGGDTAGRGDVNPNAVPGSWADNSMARFFGINNVDNTNAGLAVGALCIINAFVYLTDAILALRHNNA